MTDRLISSYRKCIYYLNSGLGKMGFLKHANMTQLLEYYEQKRKEKVKKTIIFSTIIVSLSALTVLTY